MERRERKKMNMRFLMKILIFLGLTIGTFGMQQYAEDKLLLKRAGERKDIKMLIEFADKYGPFGAQTVYKILEWELNTEEDQILRQEFLIKMILNENIKKLQSHYIRDIRGNRLYKLLQSCTPKNIKDRVKLIQILIRPFKEDLEGLICVYEHENMLHQLLLACSSDDVQIYAKVIHTLIYPFKDDKTMLKKLGQLKDKGGIIQAGRTFEEQILLIKRHFVSMHKGYLAIYMERLHNFFKNEFEDTASNNTIFTGEKIIVKKEYDNAVFWGDLDTMKDLVDKMSEEEKKIFVKYLMTLMNKNFLKVAINKPGKVDNAGKLVPWLEEFISYTISQFRENGEFITFIGETLQFLKNERNKLVRKK